MPRMNREDLRARMRRIEKLVAGLGGQVDFQPGCVGHPVFFHSPAAHPKRADEPQTRCPGLNLRWKPEPSRDYILDCGKNLFRRVLHRVRELGPACLAPPPRRWLRRRRALSIRIRRISADRHRHQPSQLRLRLRPRQPGDQRESRQRHADKVPMIRCRRKVSGRKV